MLLLELQALDPLQNHSQLSFAKVIKIYQNMFRTAMQKNSLKFLKLEDITSVSKLYIDYE